MAPSAPGTYALILRSDGSHGIRVGRLGAMDVAPGFYVYVGSAFGPGGLAARTERHRRGDGRTHWHIDHLRAVTSVVDVWTTNDPVRREHDWAAVFREWPGATVPSRGFGASDCACETHLVRLPRRPTLSRLRRVIAARLIGHTPIERCRDR